MILDKGIILYEYKTGKIFEALLKTGIGMNIAQNSRPASGSEHVIANGTFIRNLIFFCIFPVWLIDNTIMCFTMGELSAKSDLLFTVYILLAAIDSTI